MSHPSTTTRGRGRGRSRGRGRGGRNHKQKHSVVSEPGAMATHFTDVRLSVKNGLQIAPQNSAPFSPHPPYFDVGDEVFYNQIGHRSQDEVRPSSPFAWRKWRTYIVRRNEYLTPTSKWMYHIAEIGGDTLTLAAEENLIDIPYPPHTRVDLAEAWVGGLGRGEVDKGGKDKMEAKWIVKSCRLVVGNKSESSYVVYDLQNENGDGLSDLKFNMKAEALVPYGGPKPDMEGHWRA